MKARKSFESKKKHLNYSLFPKSYPRKHNLAATSNGERTNIQGQTLNSFVVDTTKSCSFPKLTKKSLNASTRSYSKPLPFIVNRKRVKKDIKFRRKCSQWKGDCMRTKIIRSHRRKKKVVCQVRRQEVSQPISPKPAKVKQLHAPWYHISYKNLLPVYEMQGKSVSS